jgi:hypothetical protein
MGEPEEVPRASITEARIRAAFDDRALITAKMAARLLGITARTLQGMQVRGEIGSIPISKGARRYREIDIRTFLSTGAPQRETQIGFNERRERGARAPSRD